MALVKKEHSLPTDHPVYKEGRTMNVGGPQSTEPEKQAIEVKRRGGLTWRGFAKPDDPIYKEGWSIHIGPLLGTATASPKSQQSSPVSKGRSSPRKKKVSRKKKVPPKKHNRHGSK